jgi:hypothetical protein
LAITIAAAAGAREDPGMEDWLGAVTHVLDEIGLQHQQDIVMEISGREVSRGFALAGCDGLLFVVPLPSTAQSLARLAPQLNLEALDVRYLFQGVSHDRAPRLKRLLDRVARDLTGAVGVGDYDLIAFAEAGECGLSGMSMSAVSRIDGGFWGSAGTDARERRARGRTP